MGLVPTLRQEDEFDPQEIAAATFRRRLAPLLVLFQQHEGSTDLFLDGDEIRLAFGNERLVFRYDDFPCLLDKPDGPRLTRGIVRAAAANAAVCAGVEFGPAAPAKPRFSVVIPPDLRVSFVRPPISDGWHGTIRYLRGLRLSLEDYIEQKVVTSDQASEIREMVTTRTNRPNIIISGGTGTGKTTFLKAIATLFDPQERVITIEDAAELGLTGANVVPLYTSLGVNMSHLLQQVLRMTPDRIVVGEVRGPEALELARAMNTGTDGILSTIHSDGGEEALDRLHTLAVEAQPSYPLKSVVRAVDVVLQLSGRGKDRKLTDIWRVPSDSRAFSRRLKAPVPCARI